MIRCNLLKKLDKLLSSSQGIRNHKGDSPARLSPLNLAVARRAGGKATKPAIHPIEGI